ncbi:TlpA family protein disulfide reductase [Nocardia uniformis]|uniref:TlpA family protein disulfide reductase n=1 Tax=Nocardia uniformis TaxID=53432 RepID=UPI000B20BC6E|nr:TlpA disulfide reductase family protein [Nocardia uniformis]
MTAEIRTGTWWRWVLLAVIVVVASGVAVWGVFGEDSDGNTAEGTKTRPVPAVSDQQRAAAALAACPQPSGAGDVDSGTTRDSPLRGITVDCLADGRSVDLAAALAGKPALLNLWAYWCGPCAEELPLLQDFSDRAGDALTVLTVHSDPEAAKALARLAGLDVHLPGVQDAEASIRTAVGAPAVLPITVLLRADATVAKVVVRAFTSVDDIAATVDAELGVKA